MTKNEIDKGRVKFRKQKSGAQKKKLKQSKDAMARSLAGSLTKLFNARAQKSQSLSQLEEVNNESVDMVLGVPSKEGDDVTINESIREQNEDHIFLNDNIMNKDADGEVSSDGHVERINESADLAKEMQNKDPILVDGNVQDESGNEDKDKQNMLNIEKVIGVYCNPGTMTKNGNEKHLVGFRKKNSGAYNRKLKRQRDEMAQSLTGSISRMFNARAKKSRSLSQVGEAKSKSVVIAEGEPSTNEDKATNNEYHISKSDDSLTENANGEAGGECHMKPLIGSLHVANEENKEMYNEDFVLVDGNHTNESGNKEKKSMLDVNYDPGLWGTINDAKRIMLVKRGPIKILKDQFPSDKNNGRRFSSKHYNCRDTNGNDYERKWLVYSNELNKVFCFCCKLFKSCPMASNLAENGSNGWHNMPSKLREHERNIEHKRNFVRWVDLKNALRQKATIDQEIQRKVGNVATIEFGETHSEYHITRNDTIVTSNANGEAGGDGHVRLINKRVYGTKEEFKEMHNEDFVGKLRSQEKESILNLEKDGDVNYDPGLWGNLNDAKRLLLVQRGPVKILKDYDDFPRYKKTKRRFSSKHYIHHQKNGENYERKWLVYSNEIDKVFCFCCKLFKSKAMASKLGDKGTNDWHHLSAKLLEHERNREHTRNVIKWVDLKKGLKLKATIDEEMQKIID